MTNPVNPATNVQNQTDVLKKSMTDLNNTLLLLAKAQEDFGKSLEKNGEQFKEQTKSVGEAARSLKEFNTQLGENAKAIEKSKSTLDQNKTLVTDLQKLYDSLSKSQGANSEQLKTLGNDIVILNGNINDQEKAIAKSKQTFDYHKASVDAAKSALEKLKA